MSQVAPQPEFTPTTRARLVEMFSIAAPSVVTMTSYTVMQFVDGLMVSRIPGDGPYVAAQGNGGIVVWLLVSFALGVTGVINSFVSQNLGAGTPRKGSFYAWAGLWMSIASGLVLAMLIPLAPMLFGFFGGYSGHSEELIKLETVYAQIMLGGIGLTMASRALSHFFYGLHRPIVVMVAALVANLVNVLMNAILIFGEAGPPEGTPFADVFREIAQVTGAPTMGVAGAAVGTVIGAIVEFVIPLVLFLSPRYNREFGTRSAWKPEAKYYKDIARIGWPAGAMFTNEIVCWSYLMATLVPMAGVAAGEDGDLHNTAGWIALRYMHLSFMPAVGLSIALTAMVGKRLGAKRPDLAAATAQLGLLITVGYMLVCAALFVMFREPLIELFANTRETDPDQVALLVAIGAKVMIIAAVFQVFDATAISLTGVLRGAGDTFFPGMVTIIASWTCIVGAGHLAIALFPGWGSVGPWSGAALYIIVLGLALGFRYVGGKWKTMSLVDGSTDTTLTKPDQETSASS
ncbi:MAG: MATE family efflux transporter [Planctomycetota bacterium]